MKDKKLQQGLTLIEILIGTTIFAITLTLAAGVFSGSIKYQKKAEVARELDHQVRSAIDSITNDIRNSSRKVNNNYYYFMVLDEFNNSTTSGDVLTVAVGDNEIREYYLDNYQHLKVKTWINKRGGSTRGSRQITGKNIKVTDLEFYAHPAKVAGASQVAPESSSYPWVTIKMTAQYDDARGQTELETEIVQVQTTVSPRDFKFWY